MSLRSIFTARFCMSLGAALTVATVLGTHRDDVTPNLEGPGIVFVYFASECATPGVAVDCREIQQPARPSFETMEGCMAYADKALKAEKNPRLLGSCMKVREG